MLPFGLIRFCGVTGILESFDSKKSRGAPNGRNLEGVIHKSEPSASGPRLPNVQLTSG
jgi:hypothetical protein